MRLGSALIAIALLAIGPALFSTVAWDVSECEAVCQRNCHDCGWGMLLVFMAVPPLLLLTAPFVLFAARPRFRQEGTALPRLTSSSPPLSRGLLWAVGALVAVGVVSSFSPLAVMLGLADVQYSTENGYNQRTGSVETVLFVSLLLSVLAAFAAFWSGYRRAVPRS